MAGPRRSRDLLEGVTATATDGLRSEIERNRLFVDSADLAIAAGYLFRPLAGNSSECRATRGARSETWRH